MYALVALLVLVAMFVVVAGTFNWGRAALDSNRKARVESDKALAKSERALRSIANGAGNPVLEAQIALDEINNYRHKEISNG